MSDKDCGKNYTTAWQDFKELAIKRPIRTTALFLSILSLGCIFTVFFMYLPLVTACAITGAILSILLWWLGATIDE